MKSDCLDTPPIKCKWRDMSEADVDNLLEDVARRGAKKAMDQMHQRLVDLGLGDKHAAEDIKQVRGMLRGLHIAQHRMAAKVREATIKFWDKTTMLFTVLFWTLILLGVYKLLGKDTPQELIDLLHGGQG